MKRGAAMSKGENIHWNDPLFLVSRGMDGDLSASEQIRLEELLAASAELRIEADKLRSVAQLVESRRTVHAQVDWKLHEKLVLAEIAEDESELAGVDDLLLEWGGRAPEYDERALADGVMARIAPARERKRSIWRVVGRLGAPLAAAAAIALAVTGTWYAPVAMPVTVVVIGPVQRGGESDAPVAIVSFARTAVHPVPTNDSLTFGYMTLGSSPIGQTREESPL
jgi:hypothetical protein